MGSELRPSRVGVGVGALGELAVLDCAAVDSYGAAVGALASDADRAQLERFRDDHRRHQEELAAVLRELGVDPPHGGELSGVVAKGRVVLSSFLGDEAVLRALLRNETPVDRRYDEALLADLPPALREVLARARADEHRHMTWLAWRLDTTTLDPLRVEPSIT